MGTIHDITIQHKGKRLKVLNLKKRKNIKTDVRSADMLELFFWLCLHQSDIKNGGMYNHTALQLRHTNQNDSGVGFSERSIRSMLGLPIDVKGTASSIDIDEEDFEGEVKEIQGTSGKFTDIKMNKNGRAVWNVCRKELQEHSDHVHLTDEQRRKIEVGELSSIAVKEFPLQLKEIFKRHLRPSNALQHEKRIYCGGHECFLTVHQVDYDVAWIKPRVTMGGCIKYTLSRRYLTREIIKILKNENFQHSHHQSIPQVTVSLEAIRKFLQQPGGLQSLSKALLIFK